MKRDKKKFLQELNEKDVGLKFLNCCGFDEKKMKTQFVSIYFCSSERIVWAPMKWKRIRKKRKKSSEWEISKIPGDFDFGWSSESWSWRRTLLVSFKVRSDVFFIYQHGPLESFTWLKYHRNLVSHVAVVAALSQSALVGQFLYHSCLKTLMSWVWYSSHPVLL